MPGARLGFLQAVQSKISTVDGSVGRISRLLAFFESKFEIRFLFGYDNSFGSI